MFGASRGCRHNVCRGGNDIRRCRQDHLDFRPCYLYRLAWLRQEQQGEFPKHTQQGYLVELLHFFRGNNLFGPFPRESHSGGAQGK